MDDLFIAMAGNVHFVIAGMKIKIFFVFVIVDYLTPKRGIEDEEETN